MVGYPELEKILEKSSRLKENYVLSCLSASASANQDCPSTIDEGPYFLGDENTPSRSNEKNLFSVYRQAIYDGDYWRSADAVKGKGLTKIGRVALKSGMYGGSFTVEDVVQLYQMAFVVLDAMKASMPTGDSQIKNREVMVAHQAVDVGYFAFWLYQRWPEEKGFQKEEKGLWAFKAYTHFSKARRILSKNYLKDTLFKRINDGDLYAALKESAVASELESVARLAIEVGEMIAAGGTKKKVREQITTGNEELKKKFGIAA
ncbi:hypothetical protein HYU13_02110 [Candidatus Woesearchaeota archaeon]|nr:hypothetical protein [Candidatus Woesearchaeota archaeon]